MQRMNGPYPVYLSRLQVLSDSHMFDNSFESLFAVLSTPCVNFVLGNISYASFLLISDQLLQQYEYFHELEWFFITY